MICYNCGWNNLGDSICCEKCGNKLIHIYFDNSFNEIEEGNGGLNKYDYIKDKAQDIYNGVFNPGDIFYSKYVLEQFLNEDSNSEIWLAIDRDLDIRVCIKILISGKEHIEVFKNEYVMLQSLNHKNIIHPYFLGTYKDYSFYVMPYYSERTVRQLIGKIDEDMGWKFYCDIIEALFYLHERSIVHGNVNPDSIQIDTEGNFILCGFSCDKKDSVITTKNISCDSNFSYMAPELFREFPLSHSSWDIWAFGATLYELIDGNLPFGRMGGLMQKNGAKIPYCSFHSKFIYKWKDIQEAMKDQRFYYRRTLEYLIYPCLILDSQERIAASTLAYFNELKIIFSKNLQKYGVVKGDGTLIIDIIYDEIRPFSANCSPGPGRGSPRSMWFIGAFFRRGNYCGYLKIGKGSIINEYDISTLKDYQFRCSLT